MSALLATAPGQLEVVALDEPAPPAEGELLVRVEYSSVQPLDWEVMSGSLGVGLPHVMGFDGVGVVADSRCGAFPAGSRVAFMLGGFPEEFGCWRTAMPLSPTRACLAKVPNDLAPQEAAAGITSTLTALACLRHFSAGAVLVVPGACGAVGLALQQLASRRGMHTVGLVRGAARAAWLTKELGGRGNVHAVDVTMPNWREFAEELCGNAAAGRGADGVIDGVGGSLLAEVAQHLIRPCGTLIRYGSVSGEPDAPEVGAAIKRLKLRLIKEGAASVLALGDAAAQLQAAMDSMAKGEYHCKAWQLVSWRDAANTVQPQPSWSRHVSQFKEGRIGRMLLKFD